MGPQDVINTIQSLPRTPAEAGIIPIIPVNLKRKLEYKNTHLAQLVNTDKIYKYLDFLSKNGHPSYKFYDDFNTYEKGAKFKTQLGQNYLYQKEMKLLMILRSTWLSYKQWKTRESQML